MQRQNGSPILAQHSIESLTNAFVDFNLVIERLQKTHEVLLKQIELLQAQLSEKNAELETKFTEGENIKNFLHNILENIYTGVIVIDNKGFITHFNRAAEMMTGYSKDEVIGVRYSGFGGRISVSDTTSPNSVYPTEDTSPTTDTPIPQTKSRKTKIDTTSALYTLSTGKESYHREKKILTHDRQVKSVEYSTTLLKDNDNNILGVVEIFNDISETKILQDRISQVETLAALGEMSASVAHEIRNPLAGITGFAGLLDRQIPEDDPKKSLVKSIIVGTTKLNAIICDLLTLTKPQKLNLTQVNLYSFLSDLVSYFTQSIPLGEKEIKIDLQADNKDTTVTIDVQLFQQIILNLLKNAADAMDKKGKITISTRTNTFEPLSMLLDDEEKDEMIKLFSDIEISITDTGCGMPPEIIQKVFNPFFTTKDEGNGLGLAISKKIIQLHKGDIHIKSAVGKGTTFTINIPLYGELGIIN